MSADLIISEKGRVMIARDGRFSAEVTRIDYDAATQALTLHHADETETPIDFPIPVSPRLAAQVAGATRVLVVALENGRVAQGYDVPLTRIEAV